MGLVIKTGCDLGVGVRFGMDAGVPLKPKRSHALRGPHSVNQTERPQAATFSDPKKHQGVDTVGQATAAVTVQRSEQE